MSQLGGSRVMLPLENLDLSLLKCLEMDLNCQKLQGVDRPNTTPIGQDRKFRDLRVLLCRVHLSKTSLFLSEIRGGFLDIFHSKGWFCITCHLFIRICLRSGIDRQYSVTNGKILLHFFCLFCRADIVRLKLTSDRVIFKRLSG